MKHFLRSLILISIPVFVSAAGFNGLSGFGTANTVTVSAGEGVITINPSNIATLSSLSLRSGTLSPIFASGTADYTASVPNSTTSLTVTATTTDANATIAVNGTAAISGSASGALALNVGLNIIRTAVTAQDGVTIETYTVYVNRQPPDQAVIAGAATATVNFPNAGVIYNWVNSNPGIGLAASGTGNIASFTAVNTGNSPITATITAAPVPLAYITDAGSGTISVINTATDAVVSTITVGRFPEGVAVSADGSKVYVANASSATVSVINTASNTVVSTIALGAFPYCISVSPDGSNAYVTNTLPYTVSVISTAANAVVSTITAGINPIGVSVSPDGSKAYVVNGDSNTVSVINTATNIVASTITVGRAPFGVSVSPDGSKIYVTNSFSSTVSVVNTATNTVVSTIAVGGAPYGISVSPDGSEVYVANSGSNNVSVINTATNTVVATIAAGNKPDGVSVSPDGGRVYVTNEFSNTVSVINTATNTVVFTIPAGSAPFSIGNFITGTGVGPVSFTITVNPGNKAAQTITFNPLSPVTYGSADFSPGATSNNNGIPITYTSDNTAVATIVNGNIHVIGAGTANITALQAGDATHYAATDVVQQLTVTKAVLTVTADNKSRNYGQVNPALTVTYSGFVNGDGAAQLNIRATASTTATATTAPGNYTITPGGAISGNYSFNYVNGILAIIPLTNANLNDLTLSSGTLSPAFATNNFTYKTEVENNVGEITLTATFDSTATAEVNGSQTANGSASSNIPLNVGDNVIILIITAQDGVTKNTYTVDVYRGVAPSSITATDIVTPNGDGKNDTWVIKDIELYPNNTVKIYDRGGREVYSKHGYLNEWDGTLNGVPLNEGTYYYVVNLGTGLYQFKGFITLLRSH